MAKRKSQGKKGKQGNPVVGFLVGAGVLVAIVANGLGGNDSPSLTSSTAIPRTATSRPVESTRTPRPTEVIAETYYANDGARLRSCARTDCDVIDTLAGGDALLVSDEIEGQAVNAGNGIWYKVEYNGREAFVYSGAVSRTALSAQSIINSAAPAADNPAVTAAAPAAGSPRPGNCSTAVAMGISAEEAGKWPHLDRDKDGVACYGT